MVSRLNYGNLLSHAKVDANDLDQHIVNCLPSICSYMICVVDKYLPVVLLRDLCTDLCILKL